jgi:site-specific DNA-methyltransferase (adenine-specific)
VAALTRFSLIHADCQAVLANMGDNTVDSVCTDPPYHLTSIVKRFGGPNAAPQQYGTDGAFARAARGFMGKTWDGGDIAFDLDLWREVLRVLKPGGHLLAFGGSRTYHRMACAVEDAGFEIRDQLLWLYGSGFPKSKDQGEGRGTALKPAHEPIVMARKPLVGSCGANIEQWGTGALYIDACRIPTDEALQTTAGAGVVGTTYDWSKTDRQGGAWQGSAAGRFPANVMHDGSDAVVAAFPSNAGAAAPVRRRNADEFRNTYGAFAGNIDEAGATFHGDQGSAARFFYCAKASKRDREEGCEHLPRQSAGMVSENSGQHMTRRDEGYEVAKRANHHPTVKPTDLMRWLCRLVTPPGGLVFDPFTGSGSTGKAAMIEGFRFIGAEMTDEYIPIARARIEYGLPIGSTADIKPSTNKGTGL